MRKIEHISQIKQSLSDLHFQFEHLMGREHAPRKGQKGMLYEAQASLVDWSDKYIERIRKVVK